MLKKLLKTVGQQRTAGRQADLYRNLIRREARMGGTLFGAVPAGHHREFFCLDEHTWVWYEEWNTKNGKQTRTTRYDIRPNGIVKVQNGHPSQYVSLEEGRNLYRAMGLYTQRVNAEFANLL